MRLALQLGLCLELLAACTTSPHMIDDSYEDASSAEAAAFAGKGMHYRKPMPDHSQDENWEFYYKRCSLNGQDNIFSGRGYDCTGPR